VWCQDIKTADWSENVAPFWPAVIKSALTWKGITSLLTSGMHALLLTVLLLSMDCTKYLEPDWDLKLLLSMDCTTDWDLKLLLSMDSTKYLEPIGI
jgi:hypothetical protein